jgi:hypothetical protein
MSFDMEQRLLKITGCKTDTTDFKSILEKLLCHPQRARYISSYIQELSNLRCPARKLPKVPKFHQQNQKKIFAMNQTSDFCLVKAWHDTILPFLPKMLSKDLGDNYSAVLVRKGKSERQSRVVINIQSPNKPSKEIKKYISSQILQYEGGLLHQYDIKVDFTTATLSLLAGDGTEDELLEDSTDDSQEGEEDDEGGEYPYLQRYWRRPGMGASIGLQCSDSVSATLGCYIKVDTEIFALTVQHFISKSHCARIAGMSASKTLVSPPQVEVDAMKKSLEQLIRNCEHDIKVAWLAHSGRTEFVQGQGGFETLPERVLELWEKQAYARKDLEELLKQPSHFVLGSIVHQSQSSNSAVHIAHTQPVGNLIDLEPHMDWALSAINENRKGVNRHRYACDGASGNLDYIDGDVDGYGAGELCYETGPVQPNVPVHFWGQSTGRQRGQISPVKSLVTVDGKSTCEWTIVTDEQIDIHKFFGDSGASVIQDGDNKLVGHLWGCNDLGALFFTSIEDIFKDIRKTTNATEVCLPPRPGDQLAPPQPVSNVFKICRTEKKRPQRISMSKMQIPGSKYKHRIEYILGPEPEKMLRKHLTIPTMKLRKMDRTGTWPTTTLSGIPVS